MTSYQGKKGSSHGESRTSEIFYLEIIAALSHVEGSCCPRTLTNTRWFPLCYTEEVIISTCIIAVFMLLVNGLHFHCVKSLNSSQCSFYFSKKISQNTRSLFNLLHEVIVYYFQIFHLHQRVVMFHRFLRLETTSKSFLRNTFSKTDPFKSFPRVKEIVYSWVFLRSECFFFKISLTT